jgi:iron(III) transport system substrate-binding protein
MSVCLRSSLVAVALARLLLPGPTAFASEPGDGGNLVVYSSHRPELARAIAEEFRQASGIEITLVEATSEALANRLVAERDDSRADVVWLAEAGWFGELARKSMLAPLPAGLAESVDARMIDPAGKWIGTSARLRTLACNPDRLAPDELPGSLTALAGELYDGRVGWAPEDPRFVAWLGALRRLWTTEKTRQWLQAVSAGSPRAYESEEALVAAIERGEVAIGPVSHETVARRLSDASPLRLQPVPAKGDAGNMLLLSAAALRAGSPRAGEGERFLAFLLTEARQRRFVEEDLVYPARRGVAPKAGLPALDDVGPAVVEQPWYVDAGPTRELMERSGLR